MLFKRSGSVVTYFVDGKIPAITSDDFTAALANHRFRTIETAANEESSIGWVSAGDPTGDSFEVEDLDLDLGVWLRVRVDKKKLPAAWLQIHRATAERSAGRPLSVRERRELKEDLCERLLPRTLPSVQFIDALWLPKQSRVLLFSTSKSVREEFEKLFFKTFAVALEPVDPRSLAEHLGLGREALAYLDEVAPVNWPSRGDARAISTLAERSTSPEAMEIEN
ncbi:MAG: recombination-associated protein RdgC [Planctomycetes bacterium]|nr:recombination-associated protein RdgC [Planctomycetota bacterium]